MEITEKILNFFYPKFCIGCRKEKTYLCPECFSKIEIFKNPKCPYCDYRSFDGEICKNHKKYLQGFVGAAPYSDELLRKIIDTQKYNFVKELSKPLALLILKFLKENTEIKFFKNPTDFLIVPIPLHNRRLRWRGFNQAEEITKELSPLIKIPYESRALIRKKYTKPQARLKEKEKKENIKDAFEVNNRFLTKIKNRKIILLDDVATTLSTLEEVAKTLKSAGVKEIWGLTVARG